MKQLITLLFFGITTLFNISAQNTVKGVISKRNSEGLLQGVLVSVRGTEVSQITGADGTFTLNNVPNGKQLIVIKKSGYEAQNFPVLMSGKIIDLGTVFLYEDKFAEEQDQSIITITDDELNDDTSSADNISGLLQSSRDVYLRTAAYEWSSSFYRIRGLDSENGKVLINGIEMNKLYNGRPQWSNWGGLNDVTRNQEFNNGLTPSSYAFGGALGSTNINTRASEYREGGKVSYANSNRSYNHRVMASYSSGLLENGWAFTVAGSRRDGKEGYIDGTTYDANSIMLSLEKKINDKHSLNFTSITATNKRGKSAGHTQEVYDLKGTKYNEYWGYQNGKKRNSRVKRIIEPILQLNHFWNISENTLLNTNVAYQFGELGNSRLDYNGGTNPSPIYYQRLPSYWLDRNNVQQAYEAEQRFINDGQIDWESMYNANIDKAKQGKNASFLLYEDRSDDKQFTANTILNTNVTDNITLTGKLQYAKLLSENFAYALDLLGGTGYLDIDRFSNIGTPERQKDLLNPNRVIGVGDKFKYNYNLNSDVMNAFLQGQFKYNKVDFYVAGNVSKTTHQREGLYQNGSFANVSFGTSKKAEFINVSAKAGLTYKITGRHLLDFNGAYITKAPSLRNTFSNSRENNGIVVNLTSEKIMTGDASYIFRSPKVMSKLTGYYTLIKDATDIGFFYQQGLFGEAFVQEIVTGINKKHFGAELGIEVKVTPTFKLKGAANYGQYTYDNNPSVYVTSAEFISDENPYGVNDLGSAYLKNYKVASGPQKTYSLGFEYRDPSYWWISTTANYLDDVYLDVSPITRSNAFFQSFDGLPINNIDPVIAKELLKQEQFNSYFLVNAIGGKSWRIGKGYNFIGFTAGVTNLLNQKYKTGGYEQSRRPDYTQLLEEKNRPKRLFGPKYWYGRGATYFLNVYYRF